MTLFLRPSLLIAAVPITGAVAFIYARDKARRSAEERIDLIRRSLIGLGAGILIAVGSWYVLPTNHESPAMLITYFTSWVLGGGLIFYSLVTLIGAVVGKPRTPKEGT